MSPLSRTLVLLGVLATTLLSGCTITADEDPASGAQGELRRTGTDAEIEAELKRAVDGIEMTSEGDFKFEVLKAAAPANARISGKLLREIFNEAPRFTRDLQRSSGDAEVRLADMKGVRRYALAEWLSNEAREEEDATEDDATRLYRERMMQLRATFDRRLSDGAVYMIAPSFPRGSMDVGFIHVLIAGRAPSGTVFLVATAVVWT